MAVSYVTACVQLIVVLCVLPGADPWPSGNSTTEMPTTQSTTEILRVSTTAAPITTEVLTRSPPTLIPREPSKEEKDQSVLMLIQKMRKIEWTANVQNNFKKTVASLVSKYCPANREKCGLEETSHRSRRAMTAPAYNASRVHLLLSYPKQNGTNLWVAFYVQNPANNNVNTPAVPVLVLIEIVKGDLDSIRAAVGNKTIAQVQMLVTPTSSPPTTPAPGSGLWKWIVIAAACGLFLLLAVCILIFWLIRKNKKRKTVPLHSPCNSNQGYNDEEHELENVAKTDKDRGVFGK